VQCGRSGIRGCRRGRGGDIGRTKNDGLQRDGDQVGKTSIDMYTQNLGPLAEVGSAFEAARTRPTKTADLCHDGGARWVFLSGCGHDGPRHLVAESDRHVTGAGRAIGKVDIGSADPTGLDPDDHRRCIGRGSGDFIEADVPRAVEAECEHVTIVAGCLARHLTAGTPLQSAAPIDSPARGEWYAF
jgi:hypothetical protein